MNRVQQDIYNLAIEKLAASNLRSDLILGRLTDLDIFKRMNTMRYSSNNPGQILADIKSMLRGKGKNMNALISELESRGIPYKVRGKGLSPKDIELDFYKWHDILKTPYLPKNYSESFANNNVNRRFSKAVNSARNAGYKNIRVNTEYESPSVRLTSSAFPNKKYKPVDINIPATQINENGAQLKFDTNNAGAILHETSELDRVIQKDRNYDRIVSGKQAPRLHTTGKHPGVIVPASDKDSRIIDLDMFGDDNISPYNQSGYNNHESATILMNELMDQNAASVSRGYPANIFAYRKRGPDNPVNRMTGIDLTSSDQPFVPRHIAKNKKEYLKRIRAVRKAEDALQKEYLIKNQLLRSTTDPYAPLENMINAQADEVIKRKPGNEIFKVVPEGTKIRRVSDFDKIIQENPEIKKYIETWDPNILDERSQLPANAEDELRRLWNEKKRSAYIDLDSDRGGFLRHFNDFVEHRRKGHRLLDYDMYNRALDYIDKIQGRYDQRMAGTSQQNMDFLVNYLRSRGIPA